MAISALYNLDATLHRLGKDEGWCKKKLSHFVVRLEKEGLIIKDARLSSRQVENLPKLIKDFEEWCKTNNYCTGP